jgi:hypothetical protein
MASLSDAEILDAVAYQMQTDRDYRRQLEVAVQSKNDSWIERLIRFVVGALVEVGRAVLAAIIGWFIPRQLLW